MRARILALVVLACSAGGGPAAADVAYQTPAPARLVAFINEPLEPEFGKVFELYLQLRLAPDIVAFVPDTLLPARDAFSAGVGRWTTEPGPADSIDVRATYYVMGLANGGVELPTLELWMRPAATGESPGPRPASELGESLAREGMRRGVLTIGGAMIQVPSEMQGQEASIDPHPPADVLGGEWSPWLIGALVVGAAAAQAAAWLLLAGRLPVPAHAPILGASPRTEALRELDRLLALGWHTDGRVEEFYDAATNVLRQLSEREGPDWSRALTSSELVARIEDRWGGGDAVTRLRPSVWSAERAKFGTHRPTPDAAEQDWTAIRDWIRGLPES
jgi:hypothetical protein